MAATYLAKLLLLAEKKTSTAALTFFLVVGRQIL